MTLRTICVAFAAFLSLEGCGGGGTPPPGPTTTGQWQSPELVQDAEVEVHANPQVALDSSGRAFVVWGDSKGLRASLLSSTGWGPVQTLAPGPIGAAAAALDPSGKGLIVWSVPIAGSHNATLWSQSLTLPSLSASPVSIGSAQANAGGMGFLAATIDPLGNATLIWISIPVFVARYEGGAGWTGIKMLSAGPASFPVVASDATGDAIAAWHELPSGRDARFQPASGWQLDTYDDVFTEFRDPSLSVDGSGGVVLAWARQPLGSPLSQFLSREAPSLTAAWGATQQLSAATQNAGSGFVSGNAAGVRVAAWSDSDINGSALSAVTFLPGQGWSMPATLPFNGLLEGPFVGVDGSGSATVVWTQGNLTEEQLWADHYSATSGWGVPQRLDTTGNTSSPQLAVNAQGEALVVWLEEDPSARAPDGLQLFRIWTDKFLPTPP